MATLPLLVFDLDDARFGIDAMLVRESVWLPELTPVEEAPPYIAGIFSLRGQIVSVIDLNLRFGHSAQPYRLSDQVVILQLEQTLLGLIVSEVREVIEIATEAIQPPPRYDEETHHHAHLIAGEVRVGDDIVALLDANQLMHLPHHPLSNTPPLAEEVPTPPSQPSPACEGRSNDPSLTRSVVEGLGGGVHFCPQATPEEHAVYRTRAKILMEAAAEEISAHLPLAVVELNDEYFGIELHAVQEFCYITQPSPIPCCPAHILGAISLRGNLLTLLDLRTALNLPHATGGNGKAVIVLLGEQVIGVAVDDVHDVVYLRAADLQAAPAVLREQHGTEIKGTASYAGRMMTVLNLPALLAREEWIVSETV